MVVGIAHPTVNERNHSGQGGIAGGPRTALFERSESPVARNMSLAPLDQNGAKVEMLRMDPIRQGLFLRTIWRFEVIERPLFKQQPEK
jgi:hypothetical protein